MRKSLMDIIKEGENVGIKKDTLMFKYYAYKHEYYDKNGITPTITPEEIDFCCRKLEQYIKAYIDTKK